MQVNKNSEIGVIIGRFQVDQLHHGHIELINTVCSKHKKVIIFLGCSPLLTTRNNPLDFSTRQIMIQKSIDSNIVILPIKDTPNDNDWSNELDKKIREIYALGDVTLYGSRDSFINHYSGKFQTEELEEIDSISGTDIREEIKRSVGKTDEFRAGVIWAAHNQYPKIYAAVDIAIVKKDENKKITHVLLGRKSYQDKYRFIGGFSDPSDNSFEMTAKRETLEETGCEVEISNYIGSFKIDDWRYRSEVDKIITNFYEGTYIFGAAKPADDIEELKWFSLYDIKKDDDFNQIVSEHQVLLNKFLDWCKKCENIKNPC